MSTALFASIVVGAIGSLLLWANPKRKVNRAVFGCSATVAAWLICKHLAASHPDQGLLWLRWSHAIGGLAPLSLWLVKEGIVGTFRLKNFEWIKGNLIWFVSAILLFTVPFLGVFIPYHSSEIERLRGVGYYTYYAIILTLYGLLLRETLDCVKKLSGAKRLELQVWLCGGCVIAVVIYCLSAIASFTGNAVFRALQPIAVIVFYGGTAYAITSHRIFDARQIVLVGFEKVFLLFLTGGVAYSLHLVLEVELGSFMTFVVTAAVVLISYGLMHGWLNEKLELLPRGGAARKAAYALAQRGTRAERLKEEFQGLLKSWGHSERAIILSGSKERLAGAGIELGNDSLVLSSIRTLKWATPERLARERITPQRKALADFLEENELGVLVLEEGPSLSVLLGSSVGASRRPFTYPEVLQLLELSAIIQAALERAYFSAKAQHAEQLATVGLLGASLAHEIRNPLVSIKTFVQLLPKHYQDANFRDKFFRLISDEVGRIDLLTEQLLDLASPRAYIAQLIDLHPLLVSTIDLVASKAAHKKIELISDFRAKPDRAFTDASAAKQVMINLCFNAIQAVEACDKVERWVRVATRNVPDGIEMSVADSGPGIAPEIRPRLFQPFQTTKSSGFGLGLAICSDILTNLSASISVDSSEPGQGAVFRVTFPCQPLSS